MDSFDTSLLRDQVPVFPLPNCVLLPGAVLPLHVFEPRYRTLARDLIHKPPNRRLLAIALLSGDYEPVYHTNHAPIHHTVAVAEMIQHAHLPDGTCNILVAGRARARITLEDTTEVYRSAMLEWLPTEPRDMLATVDESIDSVRRLVHEIAKHGAHHREVARGILNSSLSAAALVDICAFHLVGTSGTLIKQRILEEERLEVRAEILAAQLSRMLEQQQRPDLFGDGPRTWPPPPRPN